MNQGDDWVVKPLAVESFCGAGGLSLGLRRSGFVVTAAFDIDQTAVATYRRNLDDHAFVADIRGVKSERFAAARGPVWERYGLVAGGPPCQGFSVQRRDGEEDPRNSLPAAFLRLITALQPPFFLFENVPGIRRRHGEAILQAFLEDARKGGYVCHAQVLNAVRHGVPQIRKRLFVVGELSPCGSTWFEFPPPTTDENSESMKVRTALEGLPEPPEDQSDHATIPNHRRTRLSEENARRLALIPQGGGMQDLPEEMRVRCHRAGADRIGHRFVYGRLHWDRPACTITARFDSFTRGKFAHPLKNRNITLREGARLQTFPDDFVFEGTQEEIAAQIGNAIPPELGRVLGLAIIDAMTRRAQGRQPLKRTAIRQPLLFD
jgi:DNA (cytosine-5)-methyltransferase 1